LNLDLLKSNEISFASPIKKNKNNKCDSSFLSPPTTTIITKVLTDQRKRNNVTKRSLEFDYSEISKSKKVISSPINIKYETKRKLYEQEIDDDINFPIIKNKKIKKDKTFYYNEDIDDNEINDIDYIKLKKENYMIETLLNDNNSIEERTRIKIKLGKSWANIEDDENNDVENEYYKYLAMI
jgi:hypothetical protein